MIQKQSANVKKLFQANAVDYDYFKNTQNKSKPTNGRPRDYFE